MDWGNRWFHCRKCGKYIQTPEAFIHHKGNPCYDRSVLRPQEETWISAKPRDSGLRRRTVNVAKSESKLVSAFSPDPKLLKQLEHKHAGERPYKCSKCNASFMEKSKLNRHSKIHGERTLRCHICSSTFKFKENLKNHMYNVHSDEKPFKCNTCEYSCKTSSRLKQNFHSLHAAEKPFKCEVCDSKVKLKENLKGHMLIHSSESEELLKCELCSFVTKHVGSLKRHIRVHTSEKQFECQLSRQVKQGEGNRRNANRFTFFEEMCLRLFRRYTNRIA